MQAEIEGLLGVSLASLLGDNPSQMRSIPIAAKAGGFKLQQRAFHVFAEAQRVRDFQTVCNSGELSQEDKLRQLGDIMDASQASCRSDNSPTILALKQDGCPPTLLVARPCCIAVAKLTSKGPQGAVLDSQAGKAVPWDCTTTESEPSSGTTMPLT